MYDTSLWLGGKEFKSRLIVGTGKYPSFENMREAIEASGAEIVTVAVRRVNLPGQGESLLDYIDPKRYTALSGRPLDPDRIAVLREEGAIAVDPNGRLRVTQAGFPVLDAVVADLAA